MHEGSMMFLTSSTSAFASGRPYEMQARTWNSVAPESPRSAGVRADIVLVCSRYVRVDR